MTNNNFTKDLFLNIQYNLLQTKGVCLSGQEQNMRSKKTEPIRIAQIMGKWLGGGVESVVIN